ncbi:hypothetical protein Y032_0042g683 [Ancylostoma ceylanicum]|uniref:C2H2-type domain-containing protein n=1 Tax=Ancylostoma ceylanicum TaxID=53326 RepID=A0A016UFZ8_9BILA|nr:hypothetical protein Y032_0042g683 [Ancylostoma ceylanicum]
MLEHRKKARRKARSSSDCISVSPNRTKSCTDLIPKYSAASYTNIDGNVHSQNEAEHHAVSSPPINHIVIDSDTDESNFGTDCADEDGESYNSTNTIRCSSATGSYERTEIVESDTTRRIREFAGKYICPCCDYCAPYPSKVKRHIANQHSDSHVCAECDMRFNTFSVLRKHISSEHPKVHRCEFCSFSNKVKAAVRRHTILNHENGVICTVAGCNMRVSRWRLKAHIEKDHNCYKPVAASSVADSEACPTGIQTALLKCSHCGFDTNDLDDYNSHVMSAHEVGIVCPMPDCSARFLLGDMDSHFATLHNASTFEDFFQSMSQTGFALLIKINVETVIVIWYSTCELRNDTN